MAPRTSTLMAAGLALASLVAASPAQSAVQMTAAQQAKMTADIDKAMLAAFGCIGQSCVIADTAGSTGRTPIMKAEGASEADIACIVAHNPAIGKLLADYNNKPPNVPKQDTGVVTSLMTGLNWGWRPLVGSNGNTETGTYDGQCAKNILIYAKGTMEPGEYGLFIGPYITQNLGPDWATGPVRYDPDVPGDFCLGLPGGEVAKSTINSAHSKCPDSNLFLAGYSQGAMVVRNGVARANPDAKAKVKGVITFGDPFNGAPIKGYNGAIKVYCNDGDGVCTGNFELRPAHLAYGGFVDEAQATLKAMARGQGDQSCCQATAQLAIPTPQEWQQSIAKNGGKVPTPVAGTTVDQWAQALANSHGNVPQYTDPNASSKRIVAVEA